MKKDIQLPYGKGHIAVSVPEANLACVMHSSLATYQSEKTQEMLVEEALANPHGGAPLCERVKGKKNIVVISSDHQFIINFHFAFVQNDNILTYYNK